MSEHGGTWRKSGMGELEISPFEKVVTSEARLREVLGHPGERALLKEQPKLDAHCRAFIERSPFLLLATSGASGRCDVSPKGDPPGFVLVLDEHRLAIPDRLGNKRLDGMRNILENPHIGLIFLIPGREETLRVNGRAWIVEDDAILDRMVMSGKRPPFAIGVEVEEAFLHCPRAFMRSHLWGGAAAGEDLPSMAKVLWDQGALRSSGFATVEEYECVQKENLKTLY
jgi:PPOX class probable FMN-dependent enzyme